MHFMNGCVGMMNAGNLAFFYDRKGHFYDVDFPRQHVINCDFNHTFYTKL